MPESGRMATSAPGKDSYAGRLSPQLRAHPEFWAVAASARNPLRRQRKLGQILGGAPAAIDDYGLPVDEAATRRAQKGDRACNVIHRGHAVMRGHFKIHSPEFLILQTAPRRRRWNDT